MNRNWRWVLPCYLFVVPMTIVGWVLAVTAYKARSWYWHDGVLTCVAGRTPDGVTRIWGRPDAQTLGWIQVYASEALRGEVNLRVHENVHVVQAFAGSLLGLVFTPALFVLIGWSPWLGLGLGGFVGGLGFALLYGILFVYLWIKQQGGWYEAYRSNPFEVQAYDLQDKYLANPASRPWGV